MSDFGNQPRSLGLTDPFRRLVETVSDYAIFLLDASGRVVTWNAGAERLKGYTAAEIVGKHFSTFYPRAAQESGWPEHELRAAAAEGRFEDEGWRVRKDGTTFWANVIITAMKDDDGVLRGFAKITRDLTDRRRQEDRLRQSEERFRLLIESVRDYAIFMLDPEGVIISWNAGAARIKGYAREEIIGRHFSIFYPEEARNKKWPEHELVTAREQGRFEEEGLRVKKDGTIFWANVIITPVYGADGALNGFAKVTRDLTDRRRIESLEMSEKKTNEFLAMLAHELRNPLAPIRNALHLLGKKPTTDPAELWVRDVLQRQTLQMTRLVDDLLDVSRVTRSTVALSKAPVDMRKVLRDAVDASTQWMQARHHHLDLKIPEEKLEVDADLVRINQVVQNLLHNAAKFTAENGRIEVAAKRVGSEVVVNVKDNGIGMTPELAKTAFELFRQGEQGMDRAEGGLGVGLTLVDRLVSLHGGRVEAKSDGPGKGSEFIVYLPARPSGAPAAAARADEEAPPAERRRVLVVDDNLDAANALRYLLENDGHDVKVAADGPLGLALAKDFKPQVMLLDIGLPKLNGYDIAMQVRKDPDLAKVTIIAVTGYGQAQDRARTAAAGFDHHLTKPVEYRTLQRLLRVAS